MLTILDICVVAHFGFGANIPWWLWLWAILNELGAAGFQQNINNAAKQLLTWKGVGIGEVVQKQ